MLLVRSKFIVRRLKMLNSNDITRLIEICLEKGWTIKFHNHPKTKARWEGWEFSGEQKVLARILGRR